MREIKFRGQLTENKGWVYGYFVVDSNNNYRIYQQPFIGASSNTYFFVDCKTVGQFTGLKDKNGIDIYEGDIMNVPEHYDKGGKWTEQKTTVSFLDGTFIHKSNSGFFNRVSDNPLAEAIGNIYQNPELLETVQK